MKKIRKIIFICKHNRFRSKVAEAIFKKLNKEKNQGFFNPILSESAGVHLDKKRKYIAATVKRIAREKGYVVKGNSRKLTDVKLKEADLIVISANNVSEKEIKRKYGFSGKIIKWNISDCNQKDEENIRRIIGEIEKRVKKMIKKQISF